MASSCWRTYKRESADISTSICIFFKKYWPGLLSSVFNVFFRQTPFHCAFLKICPSKPLKVFIASSFCHHLSARARRAFLVLSFLSRFPNVSSRSSSCSRPRLLQTPAGGISELLTRQHEGKGRCPFAGSPTGDLIICKMGREQEESDLRKLEAQEQYN